jgi:hypothetical protein
MNRILLNTGGFIVAIYMIARFYFMPALYFVQDPGLKEYMASYIVIGIILVVAGIVNKLWLTITGLAISLVFIILNIRYIAVYGFIDPEKVNYWFTVGCLIRTIAFSLSFAGSVIGIFNFWKNKKLTQLQRG